MLAEDPIVWNMVFMVTRTTGEHISATEYKQGYNGIKERPNM